ncbi:MAG TPA: hypothetical protein VM346_06165 [Sphingomicrobium sp.]|nr:hypothetical protein [Sphingomicrobium sp.]
MRAQWIIAFALPLAFAAACEDNQATKPARPIVVRSEAQDQLHQLDPMARDIGLKRAIQDSGWQCDRVARSGYVQEQGNLSMWMATCGDGTDWAIFVGPDGSAQVRLCRDLQQYGMPACVIREGAQPQASG